MVVLGLCWCSLAVSSCGEWGPLFVVMHSLLIAVASPCGAQALGHTGFSSCSPQALGAQVHVLRQKGFVALWHVESSQIRD